MTQSSGIEGAINTREGGQHEGRDHWRDRCMWVRTGCGNGCANIAAQEARAVRAHGHQPGSWGGPGDGRCRDQSRLSGSCRARTER